MKKILISLLAAAAVLTACQPKEVVPELTLTSDQSVAVPTDGGIFSVEFTSNVAWTASIDNKDWSITPTSGMEGNGKVKVSAPENTTPDAISAKVTISAKGDTKTETKTVEFTQLQKDGIAAESPAEVDFKAQDVNVSVLANVEYTAVIPDAAKSWIQFKEIVATKGNVATTLVLSVAANSGEAREAEVTIKANEGVAQTAITVKQAAFVPQFELDGYSFAVSKDGGEFTVNIKTNVEFTVKDYSDGSFPWQHATLAGDNKSVKVVIDANTGYDARQSYVKFTVPAIQDPVIDETTGEPTGETADHVERIYFDQEGLTQIVWTAVLPEALKDAAQLTLISFDGVIAVCSGENIYGFNPETGEFVGVDNVGASDEGLDIAEMFMDDAGNILMATRPAYGSAFDIYASSPTSEGAPAVLVHSYFDYYGYGLGHFQARGDVMKDGIITALIADGPASGVPVTGAYWEIKDGKATTWAPYGEAGDSCQPQYVTFTTGGEIWIPNRAAFAALGTNVASGFLYNGYDGTYGLQYYAGGTTNTLATIGDWANGVSAIQGGVWGTTPVVAVNNMAWFPQWAMPSVLTLFNAATMEPITTVNILQEGLEATYLAEPSTAVMFAQDGGNLIVYSADGAQGLLQKILVPAK